MNLAGFDVGTNVRPADGFAAGGDCVVARSINDSLLLAVVDVLGHGGEAHRVACTIEDLLERTQTIDVARLLDMLNDELSNSLGAAVGLAVLSSQTGAGRYAGIGNTVAKILGRSNRMLVSADGIVGNTRRTVTQSEFVLAAGDALVLHSDGITSRFGLKDYPEVVSEDVQRAAKEITRRFGKVHDDACCIVVRRTR